MKWRGEFYVDCCLPMGLASSCRSFEKLSTAMEWVARNKLNIPYIIHILDDFLIAAESPNKCRTSLQNFLHFCEDLGIPMAPEKNEGPVHVLQFAGIELDCGRKKFSTCLTVICHSELDGGNQNWIVAWKKFQNFNRNLPLAKQKKVTLKDLQSLIGLLNFACSVIIPGRVFLCRLINLTIAIKKPYHFIRLNKEVKNDLRIWQNFLDSFNGKSFFLGNGFHLTVYVFILMPHNLVVMVSFSENSGHMEGEQSHGKNTVLAFLSFLPLSLASAFGIVS